MVFLCTTKRRADILNLWPTNCTIGPNKVRPHKMQAPEAKFRKSASLAIVLACSRGENLTKASLNWCIFNM